MTDLALDRPRAEFGVLRSIMVAFGNVPGAVRAGHDYQRLDRLRDCELDALGLSRAELPARVLSRHLR